MAFVARGEGYRSRDPSQPSPTHPLLGIAPVVGRPDPALPGRCQSALFRIRC